MSNPRKSAKNKISFFSFDQHVGKRRTAGLFYSKAQKMYCCTLAYAT